MIDRAARNRLAAGIRHLAAGIVTNDEFEDKALSRSADLAIEAVFSGGPWMLYHDIMRYRLRGADRLNPRVRREAARWILFLKSDLPYEWPVQRRGILATIAWILRCLLTLGYCANAAQRRFEKHGNISVWPFIRRSDFDVAVGNPVYLAKPSNTRLEDDAPESARA